jgi:hypothetical protein
MIREGSLTLAGDGLQERHGKFWMQTSVIAVPLAACRISAQTSYIGRHFGGSVVAGGQHRSHM